MTRDHAAYQNQPGFEPPPHQHNVHERFQQEYMGQPHPHLQGYLSANQNMGGQHEAIKRDIEQSIARHDLPRAFGELNVLKHHEYRQAFHRDLSQINNDLHRRGILPNLSIVEGPQGFGMRPDGYAGGMPPGEFPQQQAYGANPEQFSGTPPGQFPQEGGQMPPPRRAQSYVHHHRRHEGGQRRYAGANHQGWGFEPGHTYDGSRRADPETVAQSARLVGQIAQQMGVDPVTAVAAMLVESGGNPQAVGDRGSSFGLFQLHRGGELGHMSPEQAFDPVTNTQVALSEFRKHGYHGDPGAIAAAAQRPRDRYGYARLVDEAVPEARRLLGLG